MMHPDPRDRVLATRLRAPAEPDEVAAARRGWALVQRAAPPVRTARAIGWRAVFALAVVIAAGLSVALAPPRDALAEFLRRAIGAATPASTPVAPGGPMPGGGRLLFTGHGGAVVAGRGRPQRLAGNVREATWSAHGRFVAIARGPSLVAVDRRGTRRWAIVAPGARGVHRIAWKPGDGYRVAYLAGGDVRTAAALRVVNGDGTGDRLVGPAMASVTPAWRPGVRSRLAWRARNGDVVLADTDRRAVLWRHPAAQGSLGDVVALAWSYDGARLLVVGVGGTLLLDGGTGALLDRTSAPAGAHNVGAAFVPRSARRFALTQRIRGSRARVLLASVAWRRAPNGTTHRSGRSVLTVDGGLSAPHWSPDGRWLAVSWPSSDAVVLLLPRRGRLAAMRTLPGVRERFGSGHAPRLEGWCCRSR